MSGMSQPRTSVPLPSPSANQNPGHNPYSQQFAPRPSPSPAPQLHTQTSYGSTGSSMHLAMPQTPIYPATQPQLYQQQYSASTPVAANSIPNYNYQHAHTAPRPVMQPSSSHNSSNNAYNPPRQIEVYTLADQANASIPPEIREQFHRDEFGRVIFFTAPPLVANPVVEEQQDLGHSLKYLADKARNKEADDKKRKARNEELEQMANNRLKRMKADAEGKKTGITEMKLKAMVDWCDGMDKGTDQIFKSLYGDDWEEAKRSKLEELAVAQVAATAKSKQFKADREARRRKREDIPITGFKWI